MEIILSYNELIFVDDSITLFGLEHSKIGELSFEEVGSESLRGRGSSAAILGSSKKFILKIGCALLQLTEEKKDYVSVDLDEKEAWMLRELAQSSVMVGKESVGMNLKLKIHSLLRNFASQEIIEDMGFVNTEEHDIEHNKFQDKFIEWRESKNV